MKPKCMKKIFAILIVFVMTFLFCSFTVVVTTNNVPAAKSESQTTQNTKRPTYTQVLEEVKRRLPPESQGFWRDGIRELKKAKSYEKLGVSLIESGFAWAKDPQNADYAELGMNIIKAGVNVLLSCYGIPGGLSDAIFDGIMNWGDNPQSELQILQSHLDDQFDEIHNHLDDIQNNIADLSTQVDDSMKIILKELSNAFEANYAKEQVIAFMSSSEGNFNYTQFKNYLYGQTDNSENPYYYTQAYYNKLVESIADNSSDEIIKENYDILYRSLASTAQHGDTNINMLYDYLMYNEQSGKKSIQCYYYEYLLSNRELLGDRNAEYEALQFTLDLYTTALFADHCIAECNNYQLMCIYEMYGTNPSADAKYIYGSGDNDYITYGELIQSSKAINRRQTDLETQMVSDVAYILNMDGSVVIEDDNHNTRIMSNSDESTFGSVQINQTIYLNKMFDDICTTFGFDPDAFTYEWYSNKQYISANDGVFEVNGFYSSFEGVIKYNGEKVYSVPFEITESATFNGGDGSAEDPYVISNAEQFKLISTTKDGMNKHYILIDDIDFKDIAFSPIGDEDNQFNGSLNGNGYSIENLNVFASEYVGLFGYIGEDGKVENLNIKNSMFTINSKDFERVYAGAITAINGGTIWNCYVINSSITVIETSKLLNKYLYAYAGGIVGFSIGSISYCQISDATISVSLVRNYGSESDGKNSTNAYASGIVANITEDGTITSCYVDNKTKISASATSTCHDSFSTRHPYITVRAAGIVASFSDIKKIGDVWSDATIEKCEYHRENTASTGGTKTNNCSAKSDPYIPEINDEQRTAIKAEKQDSIVFPNQSLNYEITYSFDCEFDEKYNCFVDQLYYCNEETFKIDNLNILINGETVEYAIVAYYNFNTFHSDISSPKPSTVTIIFVSQYEGENIVDRLELPITIKENLAKGIEVSVLPNQTTYKKDEPVSFVGGSVVLRYQDGSTKDVTSSVVLSYDTSKYGKTQVTVTYGDFTTAYDIVVDCVHSYKGTIVNPTCTTIGYTVYTCEHCLDTYKTDFVGKIAHTTVNRNEIAPTCTEEGKSADMFCTVCQQTIEFGETLPPIGHHYVDGSVDAGAHYCKICGHGEEHLFRTTEYETEVLCTCVICGYTAKFDANSREQISKLPRIVVSDAYSLNGENEVVVYLELYSNVGITSAYFSVYFGDELEFVSCSYGNILYKHSTSAFMLYSDHLNVSLAQANTEVPNPDYEVSNTLLKLVFRTPKNATTGKEYPILVVNKAENSNGMTKFVDKFTNSKGEPLDFIALNGKIKIVDRLPGDVVGDGTIDLLDAAIISKYSVLEGVDRVTFLANMKKLYKSFDISYGDVTLDNTYTSADIVQILRYIVGGYEARILAKEFYIKLNYNDGTGEEANISAKYDENGKIILNGLPIVERDGYRFDGWYYGFGKDANKMDGNYQWNYDAIEQTLYAHYTLNSISFVGNGSTGDKTMNSISYGDMDEWSVNNEFEKVSNVYFDSKYSETASYGTSLSHTFQGWALSFDGDIVYRIGDVISLKDDEIGNLTLYAIWSTEYITLSSLNRVGYKLSEWTSDKENFNVVGNINSNYPITSDTTVYAKWILIEYTIIYDGNGCTSGNTVDVADRLHSAQTNYSLVANSYIKIGYHFMGWNTEADGSGISYTEREKVSYIPSESNGFVTLYAQWFKNTYSVVFNKNTPYYGEEPTQTMEPISCVYDESIYLPTNTFKVNGWIFKGWSTSPNESMIYKDKAEIINLTSEHEGKFNLYAVWEVDPYNVGKYVSNGVIVSDTDGNKSYMIYNDINKISQITYNEKVIVDWSSYTSDNDNNKDLDISNTSEMYFIGNPNVIYTNLNINIKHDVTIHFDNFKIEGNIKASKINTFTLTLDLTNDNLIQACENSAVYNFKNLYIIGNGDIKIVGGNGIDGENGEPLDITNDDIDYPSKASDGASGSDGQMAISCQTIILNCFGNITLIGGNGGNGGDGGDVTGVANRKGKADLPDGGDGGRGGNGGMPIDLDKLVIHNCQTLMLFYGDGGRGGNGGDGGNGFNSGSGGNGGNGGNSFGTKEYGGYTSGNGGNGGNSGNRIYASILRFDDDIFGLGGSRGEIGKAGSAGEIDDDNYHGTKGSDGKNGEEGILDCNYHYKFESLFSDKAC